MHHDNGGFLVGTAFHEESGTSVGVASAGCRKVSFAASGGALLGLRALGLGMHHSLSSWIRDFSRRPGFLKRIAARRGSGSDAQSKLTRGGIIFL
jgi:hypothetical protein